MPSTQTVDCSTGTVTHVPLTAEQIAERQAARVSAQQAEAIEATQDRNRRTIEQRLTDDLAAMQAIIDTPNQSMDTAALRKAAKDQARALRRLIRLQLRLLDGTD